MIFVNFDVAFRLTFMLFRYLSGKALFEQSSGINSWDLMGTHGPVNQGGRYPPTRPIIGNDLGHVDALRVL